MAVMLEKNAKVPLKNIYVSQIMSILCWTVDFPKDLEMC